MRISLFLLIRAVPGLLACGLAAVATAAVPPGEQAQLVEYYHPGLDHYFITATPREIQDLDQGVHGGWQRTGYQFAVVKAGSAYPGAVPVCRFYGKPDKGLNSHFYSARASECAEVKAKFADTWVYETSEAFRAVPLNSDGNCPADTVAVRRLWNQRSDVNHRYTDQASVFQYMVSKNYKAEGDGSTTWPTVFCAPTGASLAPDAVTGVPVCTAVASAADAVLGTTVTLTAQCSNSPGSYLWGGCNSTGPTCTVSASAVGSVAYAVYASNAVGPGVPGAVIVNWQAVPGSVPQCALTASATTPAVGTALTLSGTCTQTPTRYEWLECSYLIQGICNSMPACAGAGATCTLTQPTAGFARYALAGTNAAGTGPRVAVDVEWVTGTGGGGGGGGAGTPQCALSASSPTPTAGSPLTLTAGCSLAPTQYQWLECSYLIQGICNPLPDCGNTAVCQLTRNGSGFARYEVAASNMAGTGARATVDVEWRAAAGGGGGGGGGGTAGVPACTINPDSAVPAIGSTLTLTATCAPAAAQYQWLECSYLIQGICNPLPACAGAGAQCRVTQSTAGFALYALTASNAAGPGVRTAVEVEWVGAGNSGGATAPVCTVAATPNPAPLGSAVTLTASCSNNPATYAWTGVGCAAGQCQATATAAGNQTYTVVATNAYGSSAPAGVTVQWDSGPAVPPVCTLTAAPAQPLAGQSVVLTATCSGTPTSYAWVNCPSTSATCQTTSSAPGPVTYSLTAANGAGPAPPASITVNWQAAGTGTVASCAAYPNAAQWEVAWGDYQRFTAQQVGNFGADSAWSMRFVVPAGTGTFAVPGYVSLAEFVGPPTLRHMTLSRSPCDFRPVDPSGANGPLADSYGMQVTLYWNVAADPLFLLPGQAYYVNIRNRTYGGLPSCSQAYCNAGISMIWPH